VSLAETEHHHHTDHAGHASHNPLPASVMYGHTLDEGQWMVGLRLNQQDFSDLYQGSDKISSQEVMMEGYMMAAKDMRMEMAMLDIMFGLTENVTLMLMPMYMKMEMAMQNLMMPMIPDHEHQVEGWSDTEALVLFQVTPKLHLGAGVSLPTGSVDEKNPNGNYSHYMMQLGSGTYDLLLNATYQNQQDKVFWGSQLSLVQPLESENDSGYRLGNEYQAVIWGGVYVTDAISVPVALTWQSTEAIEGEFDGPVNGMAPEDNPKNYGGELLTLAVGVNWDVSSDINVELEYAEPIDEDYNGIQLGLEKSLSANLNVHF
jgi:hypothetical protein